MNLVNDGSDQIVIIVPVVLVGATWIGEAYGVGFASYRGDLGCIVCGGIIHNYNRPSIAVVGPEVWPESREGALNAGC